MKQETTPAKFPTRDAVSMMVEVHKADTTPANWTVAIANLPDYCKQFLNPDVTVLSHWGTRFWGPQGRPSDKAISVKATINILVDDKEAPQALRKSGGDIWLSPRAGQPLFEKLRPIWLNMDLPQAQVTHDKLEAAYGLTRTKRGIAVRVDASQFESTRQALFPGRDFPPQVGKPSEIFHFRLSPTPLGATPQDINDFLAKYVPTIEGAARKQISPKAWMVALNAHPPETYLQTDVGFVIFEKWVQGQKPDPIKEAVLVGNAAALRRATSSAEGPSPPNLPQVAQSGQPQANRPPPQGPVQAMIDNRVQQVENKFAAMLEAQKQTMDTQIQALKESQDKLASDFQSERQSVQTSIAQLQKSTKDQTTTMESGFNRIFAQLDKLSRKEFKRNDDTDPSKQRRES